jgi:glycosyltransferase involved in cell wall biosynthesis
VHKLLEDGGLFLFNGLVVQFNQVFGFLAKVILHGFLIETGQFVIDLEILRRCWRLARGISTAPEKWLEEVISQVGPGGNFLTQRSTRTALRAGELYVANMGFHESYEHWEAQGRPDILEVVPVGCDIRTFVPRPRNDPKVIAVRESLGVSPDQTMLLTVGGNANAKGAAEVMQALSLIDTRAPDWKYVCKVWPQESTFMENMETCGWPRASA